MKKTYMILALMGLMIAMAACSSEEPAAKTGNANVTFSVNLNDIDSRTISDGTTVDQLIFAVYDEQGNELEALRQDNIQIEDRHATVTTNVVKGQSYTFVFWAQKSGNSFYNTTDLKDVVVSYEGEANDENRDAFTNVVTITNVAGAVNQEVTLTRPFAQVDYVCDITEWENLVNSNYRLVGSDLKVASGAYTHLNLLTGEASAPTESPIEFSLSNYWSTHNPATYNFCGFVTSKPGNDYQDTFSTEDGEKFWLSMNYILATPQETSLGATTMNIYGRVSSENKPVEIALDKVPIKRNHRTVVYVSNLTTVVSAVITINPDFNGDFNY